MWNGEVLGYYEGRGYTIRKAIDHWHNSSLEKGVVFRDVCSGPHCSGACPEVIALSPRDETRSWSTGARAAVAAVVLLVAVTCLVMKVCPLCKLHVKLFCFCNCKLWLICAVVSQHWNHLHYYSVFGYTDVLLCVGKTARSQAADVPGTDHVAERRRDASCPETETRGIDVAAMVCGFHVILLSFVC